MRGVRRTMGCEPERIGVAFALQAHGLQLREAFDVGAVFGEDLDAFDEVRRVIARVSGGGNSSSPG